MTDSSVSSTSSASSSAPSTSATSATASILKTLNAGSGLDTASIVSQLVTAQFAYKNQTLATQASTLATQISAVAKVKSEITTFDSALQSLVKGGTLTTQPTSSLTSVATVAASGSGGVAGLSATLTVNRLATAQAATTNDPVGRTDAFRAGSLAVTIGGVTTDVAIGAGDATLDGVAAKLNAAGLGLTATVVNDGNGARLTVKGQTGAANAFTITGTDADPSAAGLSLSTLSVGNGATGTTIGTTAGDAELVLDGATFHRATNTVADLVSGVTLTLAGQGTTTLGAQAPTAAISQAVTDFVDSYNEVQGTLATELDPKTGDLKSDAVTQSLSRALAAITTTSLTSSTDPSQPRTLADLGVSTNRDGTLSVDTTKLADMLAKYPAAAEAMFANTGSGAANDGVSAALSAIAAQATDPTYGLDAETATYQAQADKVTDAQSQAADDASAMTDRLTQQYASMDSKVAAYKSTQSFLTAQVDAWNKSDN
jgi:flagellar hook-associated protein 2